MKQKNNNQKASPSGADMVLQFRPISEVIRLFVRPEIDKRVSDGRINNESSPIELYQFLAYQKKDGDIITPVVQFNDEFNMTFRMQMKEPKKHKIGSMLKLNDVKLDECYIVPPQHNEKSCVYFYYNRIFLTPFMVFDCTPNTSKENKEEFNDFKIKYPVEELFKNRNFIEAVKPYEKMDLLIEKHWPPNPAYYPRVFSQIHLDSNTIDEQNLLEMLRKIYSQDYWDRRFEFWSAINLFPERLEYVKRAIERHMGKDYSSAIYVICPQFEGIINDYLGGDSTRGFQKNLEKLQQLILSRKILLFPKKFLDVIFEHLKSGTFWGDTDDIHDPATMPNRHGILHGKFSHFESEELSLKFLILLDTLSFILLSDRMARGTL